VVESIEAADMMVDLLDLVGNNALDEDNKKDNDENDLDRLKQPNNDGNGLLVHAGYWM